ncbi:YjeF family protein [Sulfitobacter noctilucae]|uniref:bifunctional ADP-dependent NAD(P)H-hydrate dehydratase/NAD(P)H-hydrate epimerase n=1 Tax=Sulfitobacter noctilucae TaxID=1342302 RepID=UPI00046AF543|nr:bifunctional ADP-dependent NAD(P)H-hydrate dehydratase/NAD(P)H-hydrate epimerase [Sulfitobacter noctilucae]KIN60632.1 YjeF family protein [Sulfitobacter noctilucae]
MTELLTSEQMRTFEKAEIDRGAVTGLTLMERAGQGVVDAILAQWPELAKDERRAVVLCGPGNNGGDGFVIARLLRAKGWQVRVHLFGDPGRMSADAKTNYDLWSADGPVHALDSETVFAGPRPDVWIDAVFGIGLSRPVPDVVAEVLDAGAMKAWKQPHQIKRVAVDGPSGLDLDTGMVVIDTAAVEAGDSNWPQTKNKVDLTVTFHSPKPGHYLGTGPILCGRVHTVDIGLQGAAQEQRALMQDPNPERIRLVEPVFTGRAIPPRVWLKSVMGKPGINGHKYDSGHVAVFAGGVGQGGAARLAARAALRSGAGLVTVLCPPAALIENACQLTAIMLRALKKDAPLEDVADARVSGFCMGPGMGVTPRTRSLVLEVLARRAGPRLDRNPAVVLDADALSCFADDPEALFAQTHARTILTPHEGELERLFPDLARSERQGKSKVDVVREAAARAGCIILLKGVDTVIASPQGAASVHVAAYGREAPWLATAGAGDVLAGLIAGLAAPHTSAALFQIAELAAYLHVECARGFGPGLIAEDLPEQLPKVFEDLGL